MDANGRSCSGADIYRYCMHTTDGIGRPDISADMTRQRAAWG